MSNYNDAFDKANDFFSLIIEADITNNKYNILKAPNGDEFKKCSDLQSLWDSYILGEDVYEEDMADFSEYMNIKFISEFMIKYHGAEPFEFVFRKKTDVGNRPVRLEVIATSEYADDNQTVFILLRNSGNKLQEDYITFNDLLRGLSENYGAVYYVDFDNNIVRPFRMNEAIEKAFGEFFRTLPTYETAMAGYINTVVSPKDRAEMHAVTQVDHLREELAHERAYSHEYRLVRDGHEKVFRFKIAKLNDSKELHRAVIGFADVSSEKINNYNYLFRGRKILIAEQDDLSRARLADIVGSKYEVLTAGDGQRALDILETSSDDVGVVITGLDLPKLDGYELLKKMKKTRQFSDIPVVVIADTALIKSDENTYVENKCVELGANDFILKPFNPEIVLKRIKSIVRLSETTSMLNEMEKDVLTDLYTKEFFFKQVEDHIREHADEEFIMWVSDIEGLKVINEKYGIEMGDEVLKAQADSRDRFKEFMIGGRIEGDKFAALVKSDMLPLIEEITKLPDMGIKFPVANVIVKNGIYHVRKGNTLKAQGMYDRALLAIHKIKNTYGVYLSEYDDALRKDLLVQRQIAENAEDALKNGEFKVYYQPKFDLREGKTNGAEALIRWISPDLGFMNPGLFIPQFEQNGFIRRVDLFVWEEVCKTLNEWEKKGNRIVPVSVNVSRRDFEDELLAEKIIFIVDKYNIPHECLHVEVTESAYSDNPKMIADTIKKFHDAGFVVELDDFGSGYSSMTALNELELDIMKLDMSIVRNDNPESDRSVLEFSMQLAKMLNLKTVAEGVETKQQVERINSLGGDYIQGYYYSKPLPKEQFEDYIINEDKDA